MKTDCFSFLKIIVFLWMASISPAFAQKVVKATDARKFIGDSVIITEKVLAVKALEKHPASYLITIGTDKAKVYIIANAAIFKNHKLMLNHYISATGKLIVWENKPALIVASRNQIRFEKPNLVDPPIIKQEDLEKSKKF